MKSLAIHAFTKSLSNRVILDTHFKIVILKTIQSKYRESKSLTLIRVELPNGHEYQYERDE